MEVAKPYPGMQLRILVLTLGILACQPRLAFSAERNATEREVVGRFFSKGAYEPQPLPHFAEMRSQLPSPIYNDNTLFVRLYWKAWEFGYLDTTGFEPLQVHQSFQRVAAAFHLYRYMKWGIASLNYPKGGYALRGEDDQQPAVFSYISPEQSPQPDSLRSGQRYP